MCLVKSGPLEQASEWCNKGAANWSSRGINILSDSQTVGLYGAVSLSDCVTQATKQKKYLNDARKYYGELKQSAYSFKTCSKILSDCQTV